MNDNSSFNGSVQLLADALQQVVRGAVREGVGPLRQDMQTMRQDMQTMRQDMQTMRQDMQAMEDRLNVRIDVTNQNMQAQFAEQEKRSRTCYAAAPTDPAFCRL
ncbi:MAG: hypothetical protein F4109_08315 [Gammaproteobacteria bacterium]|nr:hypothetical protein [Gammaproteobacteria bacterium]MYD01221.1 hypothetical protein [Gammaproteobacteria bacterium]MYI25416.1 hypothetical protein [Gammaproteobacteria bacterium]